MKVVVDMSKCQDNGQCCFAAPDVFRLDEDGRLSYVPDVDDALRDDLEEAVDVCPRRAIRLDG